MKSKKDKFWQDVEVEDLVPKTQAEKEKEDALKEQAKKNKEVIMKWIEDMSLDGCMLIAETEFLKGQKNGELLMLKKLKKFLEGKND